MFGRRERSIRFLHKICVIVEWWGVTGSLRYAEKFVEKLGSFMYRNFNPPLSLW